MHKCENGDRHAKQYNVCQGKWSIGKIYFDQLKMHRSIIRHRYYALVLFQLNIIYILAVMYVQ